MKIGFIGAGNMACALGGGLAGQADTASWELLAADPAQEALDRFVEATGGRGLPDLETLASRADVLVLAVKPQVVQEVLSALRPHAGQQHLLVSIVAGATVRSLSRGLDGDLRIVRAMPNTPALVGQGMTVLVGGAGASPEDVSLAEEIFTGVGQAVVVEDEALLDPVTAVSGSGPAFVFAYAEALLEAAEAVGLPEKLAAQLVQQTVVGAGVLWRESGEEVHELRRRITSPGGTTQAGLEALAARDLGETVNAAIEAATKRSRELEAN